jgi:hypothetical protein
MPKMIENSDKDDVAKRRTVMILDVLSGRMPVSEAIQKASISRPAYYQLESKALMAMLDALTPGETKTGPSPDPCKTLASVQEKVERLEQDKRRLERLLSVTTRVLKGSAKTTGGRKRKKGSKPSSPSSSETKVAKKKRTKRMSSPSAPSTPTASGEAER